jgi:hypothetical protein
MLAHDAAGGSPAAGPRIAHFVFGLAPQREPFHLLHYLAIESCRQMLRPERISFHYKHLPYGVHWDLIRPHLDLVSADEAPEVLAADYDPELVPEAYRYAHHADFVRLDALIRDGGVYADIDVLWVRPPPLALFDAPFVIGEEEPTTDMRTGRLRRSICNAVLFSRPGSRFAREWRARMPGAINGTWSNHSGFLARDLADEMPDEVHLEPPTTFYPAPCTPAGLRSLLEDDRLDLTGACAVHLWQHVWWHRDRRDFSAVHAGLFTADYIRSVDTSFNRLARPFLPDLDLW